MFTRYIYIHKAICTCNKRDCIDIDIYNIIPFLLHIWRSGKIKLQKLWRAIKHILKRTPQKGWLLPYTSCVAQYWSVVTLQDPTQPKTMNLWRCYNIELNDSLSDSEEGRVSCVWSEPGLQPLKQKHRNLRLFFLMKILQDEERHLTLSVAQVHL